MKNLIRVGATENAEMMTSLQIAEITGKNHAHVMRDIRSMIEQVNKSLNPDVDSVDKSEYHRGDRTQYKFLSKKSMDCLMNWATNNSVSEYNISESSYKDSSGKTNAMYILNKKACYLLSSGYDVVLRAAIIDRWEELELAQQPKLPQTFAEALMLAAQQAQQIEEQQKQLIEAQPKVEFFDQVVDSKDAIDMGSVAKVLNMGIGRNKLFDVLRTHKILTSRNAPMQSYVDRGWFRQVESSYTKPNGDTCINIKTVVFQKGVDGIRKLLSNL